MEKAKIKSITVNWFYTTDNGEEYSIYEVGVFVREIIDNRRHDDGIKVIHRDGTVTKEFNINSIEYYKI